MLGDVEPQQPEIPISSVLLAFFVDSFATLALQEFDFGRKSAPRRRQVGEETSEKELEPLAKPV